MKHTSLTPKDRQFLIRLAKSVDSIRAKQKAHDIYLTTLEHNVQAAHLRLNRLEAQLKKADMLVSFKALLPGLSTPEVQARFLRKSLDQLMDSYEAKRLDGIIIRGGN
jgi:hypothetical protein